MSTDRAKTRAAELDRRADRPVADAIGGQVLDVFLLWSLDERGDLFSLVDVFTHREAAESAADALSFSTAIRRRSLAAS